MKTSPAFLLAACVLTGLLTGGATAWLVPGSRKNQPAALPFSPVLPPPEVRLELNPEAGKNPEARRTRLLRLMEASARGGVSAMARVWAEAAGDPAMRAWLAELWLREDPAAFIRMFCSSSGGNLTDAEGMAVSNLITRFAQRNPRSALKIGPTLQPPSAGRWIMAQSIISIMESDTAEGLALAAKHPELRLNGNMNLDRINITPADIPLLLSLPRAMMVDSLLAKATNDLPVAEAMGMTSRMPFVTGRSVARAVARRWVNENPAAALDFATGRATDGQRVIILETLGEKKIEADPADAAAWAEQHLSGHTRNRILEKAGEKLEKTDPATAEAIRARLPRNYNPKPN